MILSIVCNQGHFNAMDLIKLSLHVHIFSVCSTSLTNIVYMPQLCFLYKLNYPSVNSISERQRPAAHMQGGLKIVPPIKNLYDIQCQCVDELSCLI